MVLTRFLFRLSYGVSPSSPLLTESRYAPIRNRQKGVLNDWRPTAAAIAINVTLTTIDQSDVAMRFIDVSRVCPTGVMDWGWYSLVYPDVSTWSVGLMINYRCWLILLSGFVSGDGLAHHGEAAEFDPSRVVDLVATVESCDLVKPHAIIVVHTSEPGGLHRTCRIQLDSPLSLSKNGIEKTHLEPGVTIRVTGYASRQTGDQSECRIKAIGLELPEDIVRVVSEI